MAEQRINLPMTLNLTEGNQENSRRNSLGSLRSSKSGEKIFPHYLRASTGSCHDYCKYGRKHASEAKATHIARRVTKKLPDGQSLVESQQEREKTWPAKLNPTDNSKICVPTTPEVIKREVSMTSADGKNSFFSEVLAAEKTPLGALLTRSVDRKIPLFREILAKRTKDGTPTESLDSQISISGEMCAKEKKRPEHGTRRASLFKLKTSLDSKGHASPKTAKQDVPSNSGNPKVSVKQSSSKAKEVKLTANRSTSLTLKLSSSDASRVLNAGRNSVVNTVQSTGTSKAAIKKALTSQRVSSSQRSSFSGVAVGLASPRASLRVASLDVKKHKGLRVVPSPKNKNKFGKADDEQPKANNANPQPTRALEVPNGGGFQEKTLHVIKMESENKYLESDHNETISGESSPTPSSSSKALPLPKSPTSSSHNEENVEEPENAMSEAEYDSQFDETESVEEAEILEGENKMRQHNKARTIRSGDKDELPMKLRFKRGKVVDIQSENNGPWRLKFRRGKMLEDNQSLKSNVQMSFRRTAADGNANNTKPDSEKVVLRHQDVQTKKDAQGLFNNVIEETASKLVETRKSKVKALVGAFETVIFLQDGKPSPNTAS